MHSCTKAYFWSKKPHFTAMQYLVNYDPLEILYRPLELLYRRLESEAGGKVRLALRQSHKNRNLKTKRGRQVYLKQCLYITNNSATVILNMTLTLG
jgi:hypothetical protein